MIEEVLRIPIDEEAPRTAATIALERELIDLIVEMEGVLSEAEKLSGELNSLVYFSNPFENGSVSFAGANASLINGFSLLSAMSNQSKVPECLSIPSVGEGHYLVTLARDQEDVLKVRELERELNALIDPIMSESDRLLDFSDLIGDSNQDIYSPLLDFQSDLASIVEVSERIGEHDRRKRQCENQVFLLEERPLSEIIPPSWHKDLNLLGAGPIVEPRVRIPENALVGTNVEELGGLLVFEISPELSDILRDY